MPTGVASKASDCARTGAPASIINAMSPVRRFIDLLPHTQD
jgi:hypothetical protein